MRMLSELKNVLKHFYPVTIHRFNQSMQTLEKHVGGTYDLLKEIDLVRKQLSDIDARIESAVKAAVGEFERSARILYYCPGEVNDLETRGFVEARNAPDYLEAYKRLIAGLDKESVETVNRVLSRHQMVLGKRYEPIDLWTREEQRIIEEKRKSFYAEQHKVAEGVYACGRYLLCAPEGGLGNIETSVMEDCCGFYTLEHPERVRDKNILDLGAFIGDSALVLAEHTSSKYMPLSRAVRIILCC